MARRVVAERLDGFQRRKLAVFGGHLHHREHFWKHNEVCIVIGGNIDEIFDLLYEFIEP